MRKIRKVLPGIKTPIERIFYGIFKRPMTTKERRVLLAGPKTRKRNRTADVLS